MEEDNFKSENGKYYFAVASVLSSFESVKSSPTIFRTISKAELNALNAFPAVLKGTSQGKLIALNFSNVTPGDGKKLTVDIAEFPNLQLLFLANSDFE
jgi:hypothetical protein